MVVRYRILPASSSLTVAALNSSSSNVLRVVLHTTAPLQFVPICVVCVFLLGRRPGLRSIPQDLSPCFRFYASLLSVWCSGGTCLQRVIKILRHLIKLIFLLRCSASRHTHTRANTRTRVLACLSGWRTAERLVVFVGGNPRRAVKPQCVSSRNSATATHSGAVKKRQQQQSVCVCTSDGKWVKWIDLGVDKR